MRAHASVGSGLTAPQPSARDPAQRLLLGTPRELWRREDADLGLAGRRRSEGNKVMGNGPNQGQTERQHGPTPTSCSSDEPLFSSPAITSTDFRARSPKS